MAQKGDAYSGGSLFEGGRLFGKIWYIWLEIGLISIPTLSVNKPLITYKGIYYLLLLRLKSCK